MRIILNASCLNNRPSGARQRFIGIYNEFFKQNQNDDFVIYESADARMSSWFESADNVSFVQTPLHSEKRLQKIAHGLLYWPTVLKKERADIFECYHLPITKAPTGQTLLTIHDVRDLIFLSGLDRIIYKNTLNYSFNKANHVITVSETMRQDILQYYPKLNISVIYNGIDTSKYSDISEEEATTFRDKYKLPDNFILSVGHFEHRKNYLKLIEAMACLQKMGTYTYLVIIGNESGQMSAVKEKIAALNLNDYVLIFSGLSDYDVRCFYKLCNLFVFPSAYEGFGIPILEAMAANCPMVLSDIPVFREITENKGVYFPYDDPQAIAETIEKTLTSPIECKRLIEYGKQRVLDFSFKNISNDLTNLYKSLG